MNINQFIELLVAVLDLYWWVLVFSVILSWLTAFGVINRFNPAVAKISEILHKLTEPLLRRIRRVIMKYLPDLGGMDLSPVILLLAIWFFQRVLYTYFYKY